MARQQPNEYERAFHAPGRRSWIRLLAHADIDETCKALFDPTIAHKGVSVHFHLGGSRQAPFLVVADKHDVPINVASALDAIIRKQYGAKYKAPG